MIHKKTTKLESGMFTADGFEAFGGSAMIDHVIIDWGIEIIFNKDDIDFVIFADNLKFIGVRGIDGDFIGEFKPLSTKISKITTDISIDIHLLEIDYTNRSIEIVL